MSVGTLLPWLDATFDLASVLPPEVSLRSLGLYLSPVLLIAIVKYLCSPRRRLPPGPQGLPIIGNAHQITGKLWLTLEKWNKQYGPVVYLNLLGQDMVVLGTHKAAADLLDRRAVIYSDRPRNIVTGILNGGLNFAFVSDDDNWKRHRRAAHEVTNNQASKRYAQFQEAESVVLVEHLLRSPSLHEDHLQRASTSMLLSIMYGKPPVVDSNDPVIRRVHSNANRTLSACMPGAFWVEYFPWMRFLPRWMCSWRRWAESWHKQDSELFEGLYSDVVAHMNDGTQKPSVLTAIIQGQERLGLTDREAAWLCSALNTAGSETMSGQMSWFLVAMILHPEIQKCAQEELDRVVGRDRMPLLSDFDHLPYNNAVLKELMRWRGVGPLGFPHQLKKDDYYEGHFIPKGTSCLVNAWAMNHDVNVYGPDADEFKPERFLGREGELLPMPLDTKDEGHVTYGFGRRICVGRHISNYSMFMWMVSILWACDIRPGKDKDGKIRLPDPDAVVDGAFAVRPAPLLCDFTSRSAEVDYVIAETKERYGVSA